MECVKRRAKLDSTLVWDCTSPQIKTEPAYSNHKQSDLLVNPSAYIQIGASRVFLIVVGWDFFPTISGSGIRYVSFPTNCTTTLEPYISSSATTPPKSFGIRSPQSDVFVK